MAGRDDDNIRIKPGRARSRGTRTNTRDLPFLTQVKIAVRKAGGSMGREGGSGRFNARGRGEKLAASFPRDGGGWRSDSAGRFRSRRVVVKARVVRFAGKGKGARGPKMRGVSAGAADAHLRYLERDGVMRDGEKGRADSALDDQADGKAFLDRSREDRHQFHFIVAPEDAAELGDMKRFTRDLMRQVEQDLGMQLDWIAAEHHNTGHPHSHILVRGALDDGRILNIAGDYIAHGLRHRASELMTLELGPQTEIELQDKLRHEVEAARAASKHRNLLEAVNGGGRLPAFATGGFVSLSDSMSNSSVYAPNVNVNVNGGQRDARFAQQVAKETVGAMQPQKPDTFRRSNAQTHATAFRAGMVAHGAQG